MGEIKISISEQTDKLIKKVSAKLGIKRTEFVKNLIIESLKEHEKEKEGKK